MHGPYTLKINGTDLGEFEASALAEYPRFAREYNATELAKSAFTVAARVSRELGAPVRVFGNVGSGRAKKRVEVFYYDGRS